VRRETTARIRWLGASGTAAVRSVLPGRFRGASPGPDVDAARRPPGRSIRADGGPLGPGDLDFEFHDERDAAARTPPRSPAAVRRVVRLLGFRSGAIRRNVILVIAYLVTLLVLGGQLLGWAGLLPLT
jgi:hypothetical protein